MSCAYNCIFVVNILQFVLSKLIMYLNFLKRKESLLGEKLRCCVCPPSIAVVFDHLYSNKRSNKMPLLPPHYFNSFTFQSVEVFLRKLHCISCSANYEINFYVIEINVLYYQLDGSI